MRSKFLVTILLLLFFQIKLLAQVNYYVSKSGNDNNSGSQSQPFLTIGKAASIAVSGDVINIGEGTYEESVRPANSGSPGNPIVFQSIPGQKVIITAMQALNGFTSDGGGRYKTTVNWDLGQRNFVMAGNKALDLARWPNNTDDDPFTPNSLRNDGGSGGSVEIGGYLTDAEIPNWDWTGGSLWFFGDKPGSGWIAWKGNITSSSGGRVNFDAPKNPDWIISYHDPASKGDYYLEGIKQALDYQNEWFFESSTNTLYVQLPGGAAPTNGQIQMSRRTTTADLTNRNYITFKNLALFGGSILIKGTGNKLEGVTSLYGSYTQGIQSNFVTGVNAVKIESGSSNTVIEHCEIGFGMGSGIYDAGNGTRIENNYIHDFNIVGSYDAPINARGGSNTKILRNVIERAGRDCVQSVNNGTELAWNNISQAAMLLQDCGLFYTVNSNNTTNVQNMKIHHNWFHDAYARGAQYKVAGIYLDNDPQGIQVYRNVVWNVEWTGIQMNWEARDIDIFNNTISKADRGTMGAWHYNHPTRGQLVFSNVKVWNNITDKPSPGSAGGQESEVTWEPQANQQNNLINNTSWISYSNNNYRLNNGTPAVNSGRIISGFTDGYVGSAPDVGAYEVGDNWTPGTDWILTNGANGTCYGLPGESCNGSGPGNADCSIAPTNASVSGSTTTSVTISFDNTGSDTRTFELRAFIAGTYTGNINAPNEGYASGAAGSTSITMTGLSSGTAYDFVLRSLCSPGVSPTVTISGTTASTQAPYGGSARLIPGTIQVEEYDTGGQGVAYNDSDSANNGPNVSRENEGVDIEARDGGQTVGWTANGEWLEYTVNATSGTYDLEARIATTTTGKSIIAKLDGTTIGTFNLPNTGNWGTFQTVSIPNVSITGGNGKILRLEFVGGGANINWVKFTTSGPTNLASNPGFETGTLSSWGSWGGASVVGNNQHGGSYAATISGSAGAVSQTISVSPNTTYTVSIWGKVGSSGQQAILGVKNHGNAESGTPLTSTSYTKVSHTFTTGSSATTAQVYYYMANGSHQSWCDDIALVVGTTAAKQLKGKDVLGVSDRLSIYPNPLKGDEFTIDLGSDSPSIISIYDIQGRTVFHKSYKQQTVKVNKRVVKQSGMYFVNIKQDETTTVKKLIVE